jgi:hypothetical protein
LLRGEGVDFCGTHDFGFAPTVSLNEIIQEQEQVELLSTGQPRAAVPP